MWVNLPLIGASMLLIPFFLNLATDDSALRDKARRLDMTGVLLFVSGLTSFFLAIVWGGQLYPWNDWRTLFPLILGICLLCVFIFWELKAANPMIPIKTLVNRTISTSLFGAFVHGILVWAVVFYMPVYFEGALQQQPMGAVVSSLPLAFTVTPMSIICALLIDVIRQYR